MMQATATLPSLVGRTLPKTLRGNRVFRRGVWSREDLLQECLRRVLGKLQAGDFEDRNASGFEAWVGTVTRNRLREIARRVALETRRLRLAGSPQAPLEEIPVSPQRDPAAQAEKKEALRILKRALPLLPPRQSSLLRLRFLEEKRVSEICTLLGISRSTFTHQQREALEFLRRHFSGRDGPPGAKKE